MAKTNIIDAIIDGHLPPYRWVIQSQKEEIVALTAEVNGLQNALAWFVNRAEDHGIVGTAAMLKKVGIDLATLSPVSTKQGPCDE